MAYMYPAQSDEVILVLDIEEFLLVESLTRIGFPLLLRNNDVGNPQLVLRLQKIW